MPLTGQKLLTRAMQRYWRLTRAVTLGAQGVVIDAEDRVLLVRHGYRPGWHFPGGGVDRGEDLATALARELDEEVGITPTAPPTLIGIYTNFAAFPGDHIVLFLIRDFRRTRIPTPTPEIAEHGFFAPDALPAATTRGARTRLAEIFGAAQPSPQW